MDILRQAPGARKQEAGCRRYWLLVPAACLLLLVGCGARYEMRPTATTPYDPWIDDLNVRLCAEIGKVYDPAARRCVPVPDGFEGAAP